MSIYNFSSTDSKHYNRICVSLPNHFLSSYVNICVSTFTSNCNIEVMNSEDFIEFKVNNEIYKINMEQYSKLDSASLAPIIEDMIRKKTDKITVSMTNIDTISFICKDSFEITNMSYNMKLITGFYTLTDSKFPIKSESFETQESIIKEDDEDIPLTDITFHDMNLRIGDYLPLQKTINPPTANGYTINYSIDNIDIATIDENGYVLGIGAGETTIKCDTAFYFNEERLWKLIGNVNIKNPKNQHFYTDLMYWDQNEEIIYSDAYIRIEQEDEITEGIGFSSNQDMSVWQIRETKGIYTVNEK